MATSKRSKRLKRLHRMSSTSSDWDPVAEELQIVWQLYLLAASDYLHSMANPLESDLSRSARWFVPFGLVLILLWVILVNKTVPEAYLDEVFHVPQAQAYWSHKWMQWDPKLTTPPGLYLFSYALFAIVLLLRGEPTELTPQVLRSTNVGATTVIFPWRLQKLLDTLQRTTNTRPLGANVSHTVLNICLFPPLFFFSGLYYTDVLALVVVVEAYNWDLKRDFERNQESESGNDATKATRSGIQETLGFLAFALAALVFRQTNIFWVSVFLGGLQVVRKIRKSTTPCMSSDVSTIVKQGLQNEVYDPLVSEASFEDYLKTAVSLATVSLKQPFSLLVSVIPHIIVLAAFGAFVVWNNGVVLGHKEFHAAGIHLAQMLYIWPYFIFFSWPLFVIPLINILALKPLPKYLNLGLPPKQRKYPKLKAALIVIPFMLAVVHFNTIVHPFTLADNRHYVFYVFRILMLHPAIKYAAVPVYFLCGWVVISAFGFTTIQRPPKTLRVHKAAPDAPPAPTPAPDPAPAPVAQEPKSTQSSARKPLLAHQQPPKGTKKPNRSNYKKIKKDDPETKKTDLTELPAEITDPNDPAVLARVQQHIFTRQRELLEAPRVSFVLVWLAATSLSLITAPLVEPRYLIIPWVMWRVHLPPTPCLFRDRDIRPRTEEAKRRSDLIVNGPKFVETVWFLIINLITGYLFLYKGFEWPQEPGKIQRFMW
ncbi:CAZyme family GT59 [Penicillium roqueforti]|nr:CAZyme family GT59 [Penicillium roqueforti]KAF9252482.1 CAZyme family GT59 [Penicillium roqueforti]KAI2675592.1 CAZyme family GT59 [Penicillium roqueforti]KAI2698551.1 CAZyme family GT59 [Penicillium roqueforti]KAI2720837.1 CAZyme family GT59 [Penicillium roqueforti]KAI2740997.1 CAZyme family GT59 [Penicillium roqueforti]